MKTKLQTYGLLIMAVTLISACTSAAPAWQATDLGGAVAQMIEGQIQDPDAAADPGDAAVASSDADKTSKVMEAWRASLAAPTESAGDVTINIGN